MTKKREQSAEEFLAELNADPEFVARRELRERKHQEYGEELRRAEEPLLLELRSVGLVLDSVWDLVNTSQPYPEALPILLRHLELEQAYPPPIREGIARALAGAPPRFGWSLLTRLYRAEQNLRIKGGLAVAIAGTADDEVLDEVIELVRDQRHGSSRLLLLSPLRRSKDARARATLMSLGTDPDLYKEVQIILRRTKRR